MAVSTEKRRATQRACYARNREKIRLRQKEYYLANRDRIKENVMRNYRRNPEATRRRAKLWAAANPEKIKNRQKRYRERPENRLKMREYSARWHIKKTYGLTIEARDAILEKQGGVCAICGEEARAVDHCHTTGRVRGVLCNRCNHGLGNFRDDVGLLLAGIDYLVAAGEAEGAT